MQYYLRYFCIVVMSIFALSLSHAEVDISGNWKIIDDKSSMALVKIKMEKSKIHLYQADVLNLFPTQSQLIEDKK